MTRLTDEQRALVEENMPLVYFCVRGNLAYRGSRSESDDLIQIGMLGLCKAAASYRAEFGYKFSTYAGTCIRNEILMYARKAIRDKQCVVQSVDASVGDEENALALIDNVPHAESVEDAYAAVCLREAMRGLDSRKHEIMRMYIAGYRQREIALRMGLTQSYVSRLIAASQREIMAVCEAEGRAS